MKAYTTALRVPPKIRRRNRSAVALALLVGCPGPGPGQRHGPDATLEMNNPLTPGTPGVVAYLGQPPIPVVPLYTRPSPNGFQWQVSGPGTLRDQAGNPLLAATSTGVVYDLPPPAGTASNQATLTATYRDDYGTSSRLDLTLSLQTPHYPIFSVYSATRSAGAPLFPGEADTLRAIYTAPAQVDAPRTAG